MRQSNFGGGVPAGQPPSEAWLFAQELLGNPVPASAGHDSSAELKYREWLAQISPRHEEELRKRRSDEHEARRSASTWSGWQRFPKNTRERAL